MNQHFVNRCKEFNQQLFNEKDLLVNYLENQDGTRYGVVVAVRMNNHVRYGVSACNLKKDKFNKHIGTYIAAQRALKLDGLNKNFVGDIYFRETCNMINRAQRYWKSEVVVA